MYIYTYIGFKVEADTNSQKSVYNHFAAKIQCGTEKISGSIKPVDAWVPLPPAQHFEEVDKISSKDQ